MAGYIQQWSRTPADNDDADGDINFVEGQAPSTVNNSCRQLMARVAEFLGDLGADQTTAGSANSHTLTARSSFTAYTNGIILGFKAGFSNTGSCTLNVNSIGAKQIRKITEDGEKPLVLNDIVEDGIYIVHYDTAANGSAGAWILHNPSSGLIRHWDSSDTDIDGLLPGTIQGTILEGKEAGHVVIGIRGNDTLDRFAVIGRSTGSTYTTLLLDLTTAGVLSHMGITLRTATGGLVLRSRTMAQLNALTPVEGEAYIVSDLPGSSGPVAVFYDSGAGSFVTFSNNV